MAFVQFLETIMLEHGRGGTDPGLSSVRLPCLPLSHCPNANSHLSQLTLSFFKCSDLWLCNRSPVVRNG